MSNKFKIFWGVLFILTLLIALYFVFVFAKDWWVYSRLNRTVPVTVEEWQVRELKNGKYALAAKYLYRIKEKNMTGIFLFKDSFYLNQYAALDAIQARPLAGVKEAWINSRHPEESSLQKNFPIIPLIRLLLVWGVLGYFLILKKYILKKTFC